ncbi:MAG: hypothetical protein ACQEXX_01200 [Bacillota bacterium]
MENEKEMLMGNITRIILSNDIEEIDKMRTWAHKRIDDMADYKIKKVKETE